MNKIVFVINQNNQIKLLSAIYWQKFQLNGSKLYEM